MIAATIVLATALVCSRVGSAIVCEEADAAQTTERMYIASVQRMCVSKVPPLQRDKYPGGFIKLLDDCEAYAKLEAKRLRDAMRNVDQNGVQR